MDESDRQFLMTVAWLFLRHGRRDRALAVCQALHEADPHDGTPAVTLAELLVEDGLPKDALEALRDADVPASLDHAAAVVETRALRMLGRTAEADSRWNRHLEARKGASRKWI
jgi:Flp pilus assembly protein TadD